MVEKITIQPREVRGLGNIVSEKTSKEFLADGCRVQQQTTTVNNVSRKTFSADGGVSVLTKTKLVVEGPTLVDLRDESMVFKATLYDMPAETIVTGHIVRCLVNGEIYEKSTGSSGTATFTIPNEFEEGVYNLTFVFNTIQQRAWSYRNWTITVADESDLGLCVLPIARTIQTGIVDTVLARYTTGAWGIKGKVIHFFERYLESTLNLLSSKNISFIGDVTGLTAIYRDENGSGIQDTLIYFFERYLLSSLRLSIPDNVQTGTVVPVSAVLRDDDGSGVYNETVYFFERYAPLDVRTGFSMPVMEIGDTNTVSAYLRDEDGSGIVGETVYFYEQYAPLNMRFAIGKEVLQVDDVSTVSAIYRDEDGSGIPDKTLYFFERYAIQLLRLFCDSSTVSLGNSFDVVGFLGDEDGSGIIGETVKFYVKIGTGDWTDIGNRVTGTGGFATYTYTPASEGSYTFKMVKGLQETSTVSVTVTPSGVTVDSIVVTANNPIIESGDTSVLTVTALDSNSQGVSGVSLDIYKGSSKVDTITTDSNGQGTYTYTGTGAGDVSFYATDGTILSETYSIEDCLFFDSMTSSSGNWSFDSGLTPSYSSNGMYLGGVSSWKNAKLSGKSFSFPCSLEFDVTALGLTNTNGSVSVEFKLNHTDYNTLFISKQYNGVKLNGSSVQSSWSSVSSYAGHYKLAFTSATTCTLYIEDTQITTATNISVSNLQILFGLGANNRSMTIKNVKVKPL